MIISQDHGRQIPSVLLLAIDKILMPKPVVYRQSLLRCFRPRAAFLSRKAVATLQNGEQMAINQPNNRFFDRAFRLQASNSAGDRASRLCIGPILAPRHRGAFQLEQNTAEYGDRMCAAEARKEQK